MMLYNPVARDPKWIKIEYEGIVYGGVAAVTLTKKEYDLCTEFSGKMWAQDKDNDHATAFAYKKEDPFIGERIGLCGQVAYAAICGGLPVDFYYRAGGDYADFFIVDKYGNRYTIDVKTRTLLWGNGLIFFSKKHKNSDKIYYYTPRDYYVFAYLHYEIVKEKKCVIYIVGVNPKEEVWLDEYKNRGYGYDKEGKRTEHVNFEIPFSIMYPFRKFYQYKDSLSFEYTAPIGR